MTGKGNLQGGGGGKYASFVKRELVCREKGGMGVSSKEDFGLCGCETTYMRSVLCGYERTYTQKQCESPGKNTCVEDGLVEVGSGGGMESTLSSENADSVSSDLQHLWLSSVGGGHASVDPPHLSCTCTVCTALVRSVPVEIGKSGREPRC